MLSEWEVVSECRLFTREALPWVWAVLVNELLPSIRPARRYGECHLASVSFPRHVVTLQVTSCFLSHHSLPLCLWSHRIWLVSCFPRCGRCNLHKDGRASSQTTGLRGADANGGAVQWESEGIKCGPNHPRVFVQAPFPGGPQFPHL